VVVVVVVAVVVAVVVVAVVVFADREFFRVAIMDSKKW
jgi:hypothetical protein